MNKISVCIAAYNSEAYLAECLESVFSQNYPALEVIVVDDCGDNPVSDWLAYNGYADRVKCIRLPHNHGSAGAYRAAVDAATGDYLCPMPADDKMLPGSLSARAEYLYAHPECGVVFGWPEFIGERGHVPKDHVYNHEVFLHPQNRSRQQMLDDMANGTFTFACTLMLRKSLYQQVGGPRRYYQQLADLEWYIRMAKTADVHIVQKPLGVFRIRDKGGNESAPTTDNVRRAQAELRRIRHRHFAPESQPKKLMISTPFYMHWAFSDYMVSVLEAANQLTANGIEWQFLSMPGDSYIDRARNTMCANFLESDFTDLLFVDSDLKFDASTVIRLLSHPELIVGGAYPTKNNWKTFSCIPLPPVKDPVYGEVFQGRDLPGGGALLKAQVVSAGFMRITREALELFAEHYGDMVYRDISADPAARKRVYTNYFACEVIGSNRMGEDSRFCRMWRDMGGELWIDPDISFHHYGIKGWDGNMHEHLLKPPEELDRLRRLKAGDQQAVRDHFAKAAA